MVDDAHALGVLGKDGRGTVEYFGLEGKIDIEMGTLSKALGVMGGYVAGSRKLKDFLLHEARPILFSTSSPPLIAAAAIASLEVLEKDSGILKGLWDNVKYFKDGLNALGFDTLGSETPITPILAGRDEAALKMSRSLFEEGVMAPAIVYPAVSKEKSRIRTIVTAVHTRKDLSLVLDILKKHCSKEG